MNIFRRRSRINLGHYKPGPASPIAPIARVVDEGVMISASAVRMAVKNRLIIAALRDAQAYDPAALEALAREQFLTFADETDATAHRLEADDPSFDDREAYRRGPEVFRSLAEALRREAGERDHVAALVARARDDAWQEVGRAILTRLTSSENRPGADPDYERTRSRRISKLVQVDLASLARERAARWRARVDVRSSRRRLLGPAPGVP